MWHSGRGGAAEGGGPVDSGFDGTGPVQVSWTLGVGYSFPGLCRGRPWCYITGGWVFGWRDTRVSWTVLSAGVAAPLTTTSLARRCTMPVHCASPH